MRNARLYRPPMIPLAVLLEQAWAKAQPGRECASQNEVLRAFSRVRFRPNRTLNRHRRMTGSEGPPLELRGLFEQFFSEVR
jgi:hypothetical protein